MATTNRTSSNRSNGRTTAPLLKVSKRLRPVTKGTTVRMNLPDSPIHGFRATVIEHLPSGLGFVCGQSMINGPTVPVPDTYQLHVFNPDGSLRCMLFTVERHEFEVLTNHKGE